MNFQVLINLQANYCRKSNDTMFLMRMKLTTELCTCKLTTKLSEVAKFEIKINARRMVVIFLTLDIKVVMMDEVRDLANIVADEDDAIIVMNKVIDYVNVFNL